MFQNLKILYWVKDADNLCLGNGCNVECGTSSVIVAEKQMTTDFRQPWKTALLLEFICPLKAVLDNSLKSSSKDTYLWFFKMSFEVQHYHELQV